MRGLQAKLRNLSISIATILTSYDIIVFTETWLTENIVSAELGLNDHNIFRCDRNVDTSVSSRGGGILVAVKKDRACFQLQHQIQTVEHIFFQINTGNQTLLLGTVYIPPVAPASVYHDHCSCIDLLSSSRQYTNTLTFRIVAPEIETCFRRSIRFNFKDEDYNSVCNYLNSINWDESLSHMSLNDSINFLYEHLYIAIEQYVSF